MNSAIQTIRRLLRFRHLLSLTPFDAGTSEGRSAERHRRMLLSTLASASARTVSVATALISIPLTLNYLGSERYGMWLTISSFIAMLSFADLGLGNGLLNQVAAADGRNDRAAIRTYVSGGFGLLIAVTTLILAAFWITYPFVTWSSLFNVSDKQAIAEAGPSIAVFAVCFALSIPAAIVQKVQIGLQESFRASLWQGLGSLFALGGLILATQMKLGLPWLVLAFLGGPLVASTFNSLVFFLRSRPDIAPHLSAFSTRFAFKTLRTGLLFLVLQVVAAASYSSDPLIIAHVLGPAAVPQYSVPERMFSFVAMLIGMGLAPLWPAYGEAISRSDHDWVRKTFLGSLGLAMGAATIGVVLVGLNGPALLNLWVGDAVSASWGLLAALAIWKIVEAGGLCVAMFLNGAHIVKAQVYMAICTAAVALMLKFILLDRIGLVGSPASMIIAYVICTAIPASFILMGLLGIHGPRVRIFR